MNSKIVYQLNEDGYLTGETVADESPLEQGVFLLPARCVEAAPPNQLAGCIRRYVSGKWVQEPVSVEPVPVKTAEELLMEQRAAVQSKIDKLEQASMLNRGSRELELFLMEDRAATVASAKGVPIESILMANVYYGKLKALDTEIELLRMSLG